MSIFRRRRTNSPGANPMPCRELVEVVTGYLEGTLPEVDRARFEEHLAACPHCTAYMNQMRTTLLLAGRLTEDDIPDDTREDLLQVYRAWKSA